jgi:hypothetical protein
MKTRNRGHLQNRFKVKWGDRGKDKPHGKLLKNIFLTDLNDTI